VVLKGNVFYGTRLEFSSLLWGGWGMATSGIACGLRRLVARSSAEGSFQP